MVEQTGTEAERDTAPEAAEWPYGSLVLFGFFGTGSAAGRRLARRTLAALGVILLGLVMLQAAPGVVPALVWVVVVVGGMGLMVAEQGRYLRSLDELARLLQLQAFAVAYGTVMTLAVTLTAVSLALRGALPAEVYLLLLVLAEPVRGAALAVLARRHA